MSVSAAREEQNWRIYGQFVLFNAIILFINVLNLKLNPLSIRIAGVRPTKVLVCRIREFNKILSLQHVAKSCKDADWKNLSRAASTGLV
jgi:hypothetical protein